MSEEKQPQPGDIYVSEQGPSGRRMVMQVESVAVANDRITIKPYVPGLGNGPITGSLETFKNDFHAFDPQHDRLPVYESYVEIYANAGPFPAIKDDSDWNGWAKPVFPVEVARDVVEGLMAHGGGEDDKYRIIDDENGQLIGVQAYNPVFDYEREIQRPFNIEVNGEIRQAIEIGEGLCWSETTPSRGLFMPINASTVDEAVWIEPDEFDTWRYHVTPMQDIESATPIAMDNIDFWRRYRLATQEECAHHNAWLKSDVVIERDVSGERVEVTGIVARADIARHGDSAVPFIPVDELEHALKSAWMHGIDMDDYRGEVAATIKDRVAGTEADISAIWTATPDGFHVGTDKALDGFTMTTTVKGPAYEPEALRAGEANKPEKPENKPWPGQRLSV